MSSHKKLFFKASFYISIAIILSRILGMVREQYSLYLFGAGWDLDAYVSASKIPNVFRNLLGEGAFSAVFISMFAGYYHKNKEKALEFANKVISYLFIFSVVLTFLGIIFAPYYLRLIHHSQVNFNQVVQLTAYIMPFLTFISLAAIFMGILNSWHVYFFPAMAPFFGNVVYLLTVYFTHKSYGVKSLAIGFLASSITYFLFQLPVLLKKGFRFSFNFKMDEKVKAFFKAFVPVAFGMAVFQLNRIISNVFSSSIKGGNTVFEKGFILAQLILSVFITGISTVLLPMIAKEGKDKIKIIYLDGLKLIFLIIFPASIFFVLMGHDIASFVYKDLLVFLGLGKGKISDEAISRIGEMLLYISPGMLFFGLITIVIRGFQGLKLFYFPVIGSAVSVVLNYVFMSYFSPKMGISGLALSISIASFVNFIVLFLLFHYKNPMGYKSFFLTVSKSVIAGVGLFFSIYFIKEVSIHSILKVPLLLASGMIIYLVLLSLLRESEISSVLRSLKRRLKAKRSKE